MWPDRRLCDLLNIEHPIILAPMGGGVVSPELGAGELMRTLVAETRAIFEKLSI